MKEKLIEILKEQKIKYEIIKNKEKEKFIKIEKILFMQLKNIKIENLDTYKKDTMLIINREGQLIGYNLEHPLIHF